MNLESFLPPTFVGIVYVLYCLASLNQLDWATTRQNGMRGSNNGIGVFIDLSSPLALFFHIAFLIAYSWEYSWQSGLSLFVLGVVISRLFKILLHINGEIFWIIGALLLWPLAVILSMQITWFGLIV